MSEQSLAFLMMTTLRHLHISLDAAKVENIGLARSQFYEGIVFIHKLPEERIWEILIPYFKELFQTPNLDFIEETLDKTLSDPEVIHRNEMLTVFLMALNHLKPGRYKKGENRLIDRHPEERTIAEDILERRAAVQVKP